MIAVRARALLLVLCLSACKTSHAPPASAAEAQGPFARRSELEAALEQAAATGEVEHVWARIRAAGTMPLVFGETAMFFHRGPGAQVEWRGEFAEWWPSWDTAAERVGGTELWRKSVQLLPGSRLDYRIFVDGASMLDPSNPHQQVGGFGPNSEARIPPWAPSPYVTRTASTPRGRFTEDLSIASRRLGYSVSYRVYTPPGLDPGARELPTLFVTDGSDYYRDEMGAMVIVLDRLYQERRIAPIVVVFIDPWDPEHKVNRREQELIPKSATECGYCDFLVEELMPAVAAQFPTTRDPTRRGLLGASYGGLFAAHMGLAYGQHFGLIGMQSPAFHPLPVRHVYERLMKAERFPAKAFLDVGRYERRFLLDSSKAGEQLKKLGVDLRYVEAPEAHSWGHWRAYLDEVLIHFFGV